MKIMTSLPHPLIQAKSPKPDPDFGRGEEEAVSDSVKLGATAAWVGLTTAAGAFLGQQRHLGDTVTVERIPYAETRQVAIGSHSESGCYQYHYGYDAMKGEFGYHYGYDASCSQTVTDYRSEETGRTLINEVYHHSNGFPNSLAQGALLGMGVGIVTGAAGLVLSHLIADR